VNWIAFAAAAWLCFGLELGLKSALSLGPTGAGQVAPSFVVPLAVFIALSAPGLHTLWACLLLGLVMDLTWIREQMVVGPWALGFLLAGFLTLNVRGLMIGRNPVTMTVMSIAFAAVAALVVVAITTIRSWLYSAPASAPGADLAVRLASALYTGAAGLLMFFLLAAAAGVFRFQPATHRGWTGGG
jgi:cell shape-determining protein MreD